MELQIIFSTVTYYYNHLELEEEKEELENVFNTMDVPDSINTSLSLEKQKSVHSKKNSNMNHANLLKSDHLKNHHPFENKFNVATNPTITSTNIISNPLSKKENKINVAPQIIKPAHKISSIRMRIQTNFIFYMRILQVKMWSLPYSILNQSQRATLKTLSTESHMLILQM